MIIVGIDPGKEGAVAVLNNVADGRLELFQTPTLPGGTGRTRYNPAGMAQLLRQFPTSRTTVYIELVHAMPLQGTVSMFSMGEGLGIWQGILAALQLPYEMVSPQRWKREMLADVTKTVAGKASQREMKKAAVQAAQRLFPAYANQFVGPRGGILDGLAEAALIALYGHRQYAREGRAADHAARTATAP